MDTRFWTGPVASAVVRVLVLYGKLHRLGQVISSVAELVTSTVKDPSFPKRQFLTWYWPGTES